MKHVLIVGLGNMGQHHARVARELGLTVTGIDPDQRAPGFAHCHHTFTSVEMALILGASRYDAACVAVPIRRLVPVAAKLIAHDLPLLIEKPGALMSDELRHINRQSEQRDVRVEIGYVERFNPVVQPLTYMLAFGRIGVPTRVETERLGPDRSPINPVIDLATHDIDLCAQLLPGVPTSHRVGAAEEKVRRWTIHGTQGTLEVDLLRRTIDGQPAQRAFEPLEMEWKHFIANHARGHRSLQHERWVLEQVDAVEVTA